MIRSFSSIGFSGNGLKLLTLPSLQRPSLKLVEAVCLVLAGLVKGSAFRDGRVHSLS